MPYQKEYARLDTATRVLTQEGLREQVSKLSIKKDTREYTQEIIDQFKPSPMGNVAFENFHAIDGSFYVLPIDNGFPGGEAAVLMAGIISANYNKLKLLDLHRPFSPQDWQASFRNYQSSFLITGHNVGSDLHPDPMECFRYHFANGLANSFPIEGYASSLLDTLIASLPNHQTSCTNPSCGQAVQLPIKNIFTQCEYCKNPLWVSDWLQLQRFYRELGPSGDLFSESMSAVERILLLHFLVSGKAKKNDIIIVDGPLGSPNYDSPTEKIFWNSLEHILDSDQAPVIIGVEKTGQLAQHFDNIEKMSINHNINIPARSHVFITDNYVNNFLHPHARKGHTGNPKIKKLLYRSARNSNLVLHIPKNAKQNERLGDVLSFVDEQTSGRFANALCPLTLAHEQVSLTTQTIASRLLKANNINTR